MLFGLVVNLVTRMVPSEKGVRFCRIAWGFVGADFLILFWNLFSEKIYFIDEYNIYHRAEWFPLSQIAGLACVAVGIFYLMRNRKSAQRRVIVLFSVFAALCAAALITQIFIYGIAWLNIAVLIGLVIIFVYNQMFIAESLANKRKIIAEQNLLIEQERTQLMISQIKPHFIFNTLTSIAQLCDDSPQLAKETTIAFAKYLRGNMHSLDEPKPIPFAEELSHIKCYLQIEQVRFGEYLNVKYEIGVTDFEVPCLTVQPLIENAVKHGVGMKDEGGTVLLKTEETDDSYIITVQDDGVGFDVTAPKSEKSLGLRNIEMRLRQLSQAALHIESEVGQGTKAVITIPKTKKE